MGQTLSIPATDKKTEEGANDRFAYSISEMQGWRITMEDSHAALLNLEDGNGGAHTFFAVYDGHGGNMVAKFAGEHVHKRLVEDEAYKNKDYARALKNAFLGTDEDMRTNPEVMRDTSGATAVAALVTPEGKVFVANAGDSRSVISVKGEAKPLSFDHKPHNDTERARIMNAGGYIEYGRVNGNLALARALGDFEYKKNKQLGPEEQVITCDPEITEHQITGEDEFLVIACDGIWDCLSSQQVVDVVRLLVSQGKKLPEVCEEICELCLAPDTNGGAGIGCDNMTVLIAAVLHGRTIDEWYNWVTERTQNRYGYPTPDQLPQLYSLSRLTSFKARREAYEERKRARITQNSGPAQPPQQRLPGSPKIHFDSEWIVDGNGRFTRVDLQESEEESGSGYAFQLASPDDESDDDMDLDGPEGRSLLEGTSTSTNGSTKSLRQQLDELEQDDELHINGPPDSQVGDIEDEDMGDAPGSSSGESAGKGAPKSASEDSSGPQQGETPRPPATPQQNGDARVDQFEPSPSGDVPLSEVVKAEGLLDKSEDPLKA
ncbi:PP2C-domain-containing protein [Obba rivulosa]|uniref:protein-serine/threonine phosphatase n=1 Tax=Obba rivulosa TaxID=1052685 RepID=A0A8E2B0T9_9APHY|nr:PP2C-domain-containing protein [Obba rivulosa]